MGLSCAFGRSLTANSREGYCVGPWSSVGSKAVTLEQTDPEMETLLVRPGNSEQLKTIKAVLKL